MPLKTTLNYSPNFNKKKRLKSQIKFIIFHYTGMKSEKKAIQRLTEIQSEVSSHYLIKKSGEIIKLVPDLYIAWHAGISHWKKYKNLNKHSIGIEITNAGHEFGYKLFSKKQISSIIRLSNDLLQKYKIDKKNILGHSDIAPDRKKDPGENFPWKHLAKKNIGIWHQLDNKKIAIHRSKNCDLIMKKQFVRNLSKIGYHIEMKDCLDSNKYLVNVIKAFQRRFRFILINGIIDKECLLISQNLVKLMK